VGSGGSGWRPRPRISSPSRAATQMIPKSHPNNHSMVEAEAAGPAGEGEHREGSIADVRLDVDAHVDMDEGKGKARLRQQ